MTRSERIRLQMHQWLSKKGNIYGLFLVLSGILIYLFGVWGPLTFFETLDPKSVDRLLQPTYLQCADTLKDGGVAKTAALGTCQENSIRQLLLKFGLLVFASPLVLLTVRKEVLEAPKARAHRLSASAVTNALERMEKIASLASLLAVPLAVFVFMRVLQPFNFAHFGQVIGWVLMLSGMALAFYTAALLTGLIATWFIPSEQPVTATPAQPAAITPPGNVAPQGTAAAPQDNTAPGVPVPPANTP